VIGHGSCPTAYFTSPGGLRLVEPTPRRGEDKGKGEMIKLLISYLFYHPHLRPPPSRRNSWGSWTILTCHLFNAQTLYCKIYSPNKISAKVGISRDICFKYLGDNYPKYYILAKKYIIVLICVASGMLLARNSVHVFL
jgi:hypothetical protein